jgi:decaprenylphospho-beta-D-ribofuranose 2-oxidase
MLLASHFHPALWQIDQHTPLIFILINGYIARHKWRFNKGRCFHKGAACPMSSDADWPKSAVDTRRLVTLDGGVCAEGAVQQPDRYSFFRNAQRAEYSIARGAGLSFAAASFGGGAITIDMRAFDRILSFDRSSGVIEVETGVTLGELFLFLEERGFYLPIQPGHPAISVGGCIAADVHGKNPARDGTFINQVLSLCLFHPSHGLVDVSPQRETDLFRATCGGFGLTGIIVRARLKTQPLPGGAVHTETHAISDFRDAVDKLSRLLPQNDVAYCWHDLSFSDARFGRGYMTASRFVKDPVRKPVLSLPIGFSPERRQSLPFPVLNSWTTRAMNTAYRWSLSRQRPKTISLFEAVFPWYGKESYFTFFGREGFHESQVIVPSPRFTEYVEAVRAAVIRSKAVISFAALKLFAGTNDLVRFDGTGISLAVHLPRTSSSARFFEALDRAAIEVGGRSNAIKDSRLPRQVFEATYAECDRFRAIRRTWDPNCIFRSELSSRLGL